MRVVGYTPFNESQLYDIGKYLITLFGTYYQIFWTCPHFVKALVYVLTGQDFQWSTSTDDLTGCLFHPPSRVPEDEYKEIVFFKNQKQDSDLTWCSIV
jgi:hypothetical protein